MTDTPPITFSSSPNDYATPDLEKSRWPSWWQWPEVITSLAVSADPPPLMMAQQGEQQTGERTNG